MKTITEPPPLDELQRNVTGFATWYIYKPGTASAGEKGPYATHSSEEDAVVAAAQWNEENSEMDYYLVATRTVQIIEPV